MRHHLELMAELSDLMLVRVAKQAIEAVYINAKRQELIQKYEGYIATDSGTDSNRILMWQAIVEALKECEEKETGK
jgi:hypothetical protein